MANSSINNQFFIFYWVWIRPLGNVGECRQKPASRYGLIVTYVVARGYYGTAITGRIYLFCFINTFLGILGEV